MPPSTPVSPCTAPVSLSWETERARSSTPGLGRGPCPGLSRPTAALAALLSPSSGHSTPSTVPCLLISRQTCSGGAAPGDARGPRPRGSGAGVPLDRQVVLADDARMTDASYSLPGSHLASTAVGLAPRPAQDDALRPQAPGDRRPRHPEVGAEPRQVVGPGTGASCPRRRPDDRPSDRVRQRHPLGGVVDNAQAPSRMLPHQSPPREMVTERSPPVTVPVTCTLK
jgi:hypothetical protein